MDWEKEQKDILKKGFREYIEEERFKILSRL